MTNEKAIKILKTEYLGDSENMELAKQMGANALEKQIPKKLICVEIEKCCPVCKEKICLIGDDGNYGNYCYNCSQALDWSDEK